MELNWPEAFFLFFCTLLTFLPTHENCHLIRKRIMWNKRRKEQKTRSKNSKDSADSCLPFVGFRRQKREGEFFGWDYVLCSFSPQIFRLTRRTPGLFDIWVEMHDTDIDFSIPHSNRRQSSTLIFIVYATLKCVSRHQVAMVHENAFVIENLC